MEQSNGSGSTRSRQLDSSHLLVSSLWSFFFHQLSLPLVWPHHLTAFFFFFLCVQATKWKSTDGAFASRTRLSFQSLNPSDRLQRHQRRPSNVISKSEKTEALVRDLPFPLPSSNKTQFDITCTFLCLATWTTTQSRVRFPLSTLPYLTFCTCKFLDYM